MQEGDATASSADASRLRDVISRCNALPSERAKNNFSTKNLEQDLIRLLRSGSAEQHRDVLDRPLAAAALSGAPYNMPRTCSPAYIRSVGTLAHVLHQTTSCEAALWTSTQHLDLYERLQSPARLLKALMDALVNDPLPCGRLH